MKTALEILDDLIAGRPVSGVEARLCRTHIAVTIQIGDRIRETSNDKDAGLEWDALRKYLGEIE